MVDPATQTESYVYDANGNRTSVTNVRSKTTSVFGAVTTRTGTTPNVWKFTGEQADDGTASGRGTTTRRSGRFVVSTSSVAPRGRC